MRRRVGRERERELQEKPIRPSPWGKEGRERERERGERGRNGDSQECDLGRSVFLSFYGSKCLCVWLWSRCLNDTHTHTHTGRQSNLCFLLSVSVKYWKRIFPIQLLTGRHSLLSIITVTVQVLLPWWCCQETLLTYGRKQWHTHRHKY